MSEDFKNISWPGWETVSLIGRGSFGAVYEIERKVFDETEKAALKVISIPQSQNDVDEMYSDGYDDESITATFQEHLRSIVSEYTLMRKLSDCVNIVKCDDVQYIQHDDGVGWDILIKMELLTPLTKTLTENIPEQTVVKLAKDICAALVRCKEHNIVHRDIKPQNIFVSARGDYKLGDFGIAKTIERTAGGTKIGTYKYMAPEVYNNKPYGTAADIYSLGLVLYWLLNDRRLPFLPEATQKVTALMEDQARNRRFRGEQIPAPAHGTPGLKAIVLKACAFDPADRYKTPHEMLRDLQMLNSQGEAEKNQLQQRPQIPHQTPQACVSTTCSDNILPPGAQNSVVEVGMDTTISFATRPVATEATKHYRKWVAIFLAVFPYTGLFGVHDFYLGKKSMGIWKLCTVNFLVYGWIWDVILILVGKYKDANDRYLN